jgi:D-alanyl-D-alanine endopeptidase (penicillin-binding protein 7)
MKPRLSALLGCLLSASLALAPAAAEASTKHHHKAPHTRSATAKAAPATSKHAVGKRSRKAPIAQKVMLNKGPRGGHITRVSTRPTSFSMSEPALYSSAALVVNEQSGEPIFEKNSQNVTPIASVSKLMTAIVTLDMHLPLDQPITITEDDVDTIKHSSSRLLVGTTLTRGEVLHLALMASENRAAHALARTAPVGMAGFVAQMNRTAQSLGMANTHFEDPTGLTSQNVSTATDLVKLVQAAHRYPEIRAYSTSEEYSFVSNVNGREYTFHNTNPLVKSDSWEIGLSKTGYISEAGKCLVMQATIESTPVVIVLLDSAGKLTRIGDANRIKRWLETSPGAKLRAG